MRFLNMPEAYSYYSHYEALTYSHYEALTWPVIREQIGQDLREHYQVPKELPPKLLAPILELVVVEGLPLENANG
jgi:hypothetical protein